MGIRNSEETEEVSIQLGLREYEEYERIASECGKTVQELWQEGFRREMNARFGLPEHDRRQSAKVVPFDRRKNTNA